MTAVTDKPISFVFFYDWFSNFENLNFCIDSFLSFYLKCKNCAPFLMMSFGAFRFLFFFLSVHSISRKLFSPTLHSYTAIQRKMMLHLWIFISTTVSSAFTNLNIRRKIFERHQHISITTRTCITHTLLQQLHFLDF